MQPLQKTVNRLFNTTKRDRARVLGFCVLFAVTGVLTVYVAHSLLQRESRVVVEAERGTQTGNATKLSRDSRGVVLFGRTS
jgi:uncharacterized protein involved in exopolysaccharide biosynthesis